MKPTFTPYTAKAGETCQCSGSEGHHCSNSPTAIASDGNGKGEGHSVKVCDDPTHRSSADTLLREMREASEHERKRGLGANEPLW